SRQSTVGGRQRRRDNGARCDREGEAPSEPVLAQMQGTEGGSGRPCPEDGQSRWPSVSEGGAALAIHPLPTVDCLLDKQGGEACVAQGRHGSRGRWGSA